MSPALAGRFFTTGATWEAHILTDNTADSLITERGHTRRVGLAFSLPASAINFLPVKCLGADANKIGFDGDKCEILCTKHSTETVWGQGG